MNLHKFDEPLRTAIKAIKSSRVDPGKEKVHVLIEHISRLDGHGKTRQEMMNNLKEQCQRHQQGIVALLNKLGVVGSIEQDCLTNSLTIELTISQLEEVAKLKEVKIIRLLKRDVVAYQESLLLAYRGKKYLWLFQGLNSNPG